MNRFFARVQQRLASAHYAARLTFIFACGALSVLAFAPFYFWPVLAIAITLTLWTFEGVTSVKSALLSGWAFGLGQFLFGLIWIAEAFAVRDGFSYGQGLASISLLAAVLALYPALVFGALYRLNLKGFAKILAFAGLWSLAEWLRGHLFTGFPWNIHAASVSAFPVMMQSAAYIGSYGLSFLVTLAAAVPAAVLVQNRSGIMRQIVAILAIPSLVLAFGSLRISGNPIVMREGLKLVLVQPGISQADKWKPDLIRQHFHNYIDLSTNAVRSLSTSNVAVIWPETAVAYPIQDQPGTRYLISKIFEENGTLITGAPRYHRTDQGHYEAWNSAFAVNQNGNIVAQYDKSHLVPFGEYVPLRTILSLLGVERMVEGLADFSAGDGPSTLKTDGLPAFSPLICYEGIFPGQVTSSTEGRPQWLLNLSNDAWFGDSVGPHQHYALARLRAVEEGLPLVRSTPTGISVVVGPTGLEVAKLPLGRKGVLVAELPKPLGVVPPYGRLKDIPYFFLLVSLLGVYFVQKLWYRP